MEKTVRDWGDTSRGTGAGETLEEPQYLGESSRGCFTRFGQHAAKYRTRSNFMYDHTVEKHEGVMGPALEDFSMERYSVDRDPVRRITREAVRTR